MRQPVLRQSHLPFRLPSQPALVISQQVVHLRRKSLQIVLLSQNLLSQFLVLHLVLRLRTVHHRVLLHLTRMLARIVLLFGLRLAAYSEIVRLLALINTLPTSSLTTRTSPKTDSRHSPNVFSATLS